MARISEVVPAALERVALPVLFAVLLSRSGPVEIEIEPEIDLEVEVDVGGS
jgi:hypothetical protein